MRNILPPPLSLTGFRKLGLFSFSLSTLLWPLDLPAVPLPLLGDPSPGFGTVSVEPDYFLNGAGENIDSPEIFIGDPVEESLLLVTGKKNDTIEVWRFPFQDHELPHLKRDSRPNGIALDQESKRLFIGDSDRRNVETLSLPDLTHINTFGNSVIGRGETNADVLTLRDGTKRVYATSTRGIHVFELDGHHLFSFEPNIGSMEEILADNYHQVLYVPDDQGRQSEAYPGGAILALHPDGTPYERNGKHILGAGLFVGDGEGIALYRCLAPDGNDTGRGYIIAADQDQEENGFEIFDRESWEHLGTLELEGVRMTDGIDISERPFPGYPAGIFVAIHNDHAVAVVSWEKVINATGLSCPSL